MTPAPPVALSPPPVIDRGKGEGGRTHKSMHWASLANRQRSGICPPPRYCSMRARLPPSNTSSSSYYDPYISIPTPTPTQMDTISRDLSIQTYEDGNLPRTLLHTEMNHLKCIQPFIHPRYVRRRGIRQLI
eukprot:748073-Hanusia_phi.AAC.2